MGSELIRLSVGMWIRVIGIRAIGIIRVIGIRITGNATTV